MNRISTEAQDASVPWLYLCHAPNMTLRPYSLRTQILSPYALRQNTVSNYGDNIFRKLTTCKEVSRFIFCVFGLGVQFNSGEGESFRRIKTTDCSLTVRIHITRNSTSRICHCCVYVHSEDVVNGLYYRTGQASTIFNYYRMLRYTEVVIFKQFFRHSALLCSCRGFWCLARRELRRRLRINQMRRSPTKTFMKFSVARHNWSSAFKGRAFTFWV